mgnify:CR=1 FL=1
MKAALEESSECAVVFLDSVPQNEQVLSNYKALVGVASMYPDRVIPLPIVCAEYYFLKSLQYQPVFKDKELVEFCLSKKYYKDLPHLIGHEHHAVTFERFCKFVCPLIIFIGVVTFGRKVVPQKIFAFITSRLQM